MKTMTSERPPEPKVAGSNLAWRAKNQRKTAERESAAEHESARECAGENTDKRQRVSGPPSEACRPEPDSASRRLLYFVWRKMVLRCAVREGVPNACSMLYWAAWRAARALGAVRMDTHTHLDEPGTSLVAAGWIDGGLTTGGEYDRPSRRRASAVDPGPKRRWWAPGSVLSDGTRIGAKCGTR